MIISPTIFVLGAGASMPYGFPSGETLKDWICQAEADEDWIAKVISQNLEIDREEIRNFARALRRSHINSIDAFLFRRPEFNAIGKFAIAAHLCRLEIPEALDAAEGQKHWYRLLWNRMVADTSSEGDLLRNQVRFVSFNYDRSLEQFLFNAAKHAYRLSDEGADRVMRKFGIIHVYGQVGLFSYVGDQGDSRVYSKELSTNTLRIAAAGIRLIPGERDENRQFKLARNWFDWAEKICFLGFGFDAINCDNLGLFDVLNAKSEKRKPMPRIFASTFHFTDAEVEQARIRACGAHDWVTRSLDNVMTLRELGVLF